VELTVQQIALLASLSTVVVWFLTVVYSGIFKFPKPSIDVMKGITFVGSAVIAFFWSGVDLPSYDGDIFSYAATLLAAATLIFKLAQLIYDYLWKPILEWLTEKASATSFLLPRRR
jgi:hypothetical protein